MERRETGTVKFYNKTNGFGANLVSIVKIFIKPIR